MFEITLFRLKMTVISKNNNSYTYYLTGTRGVVLESTYVLGVQV